MAQEHIAVVRRSCELWEEGDTDAWLQTLHPDVVWDSSHFGGWEEGSVYRGRDAVRWFLVEQWRAGWARYEARVEELAEAGDRVLVLWWQRMIGADEVPITVKTTQVCLVEDEKVIRMDNYADRADAMRAVGLSR